MEAREVVIKCIAFRPKEEMDANLNLAPLFITQDGLRPALLSKFPLKKKLKPPPTWLKSPTDSAEERTKKANVAERPGAFDHVGLLLSGSPCNAEVPFS
jgi:hypothetical protein